MNAHAHVVSSGALDAIISRRSEALRLMDEAIAHMGEAFDLAEVSWGHVREAAFGSRFHMEDRAGAQHLERMARERFDPAAVRDVFRRQIDADIWTGLVRRMGLDTVMDRTAKEELERSLRADVPEITADNIRATLSRLVADADVIFKRGLARVFSELDRRFKSHDAFAIGSRIILDRAFDDWGSLRWGRERDMLIDVERTLSVLDGRPDRIGSLLAAIDRDRRHGYGARQSVTESAYFRVRVFKNGNAHLWFTRDDLVEKCNRLLAEYYGEVLADAVPRDAEGGRSTALARDLAFYETPDAVVDEVLGAVRLRGRVLEPSAGHGAFVRRLVEMAEIEHVTAVEVHEDRVRRLRRIVSDRLSVIEANFLMMNPTGDYSAVIMNPPFCSTHWMDHVRHAFDFLAPGGDLFAILPASAEVNESPKHLAFRRWAESVNRNRWGRLWRDLPPESFAASGTRVNTVVLTIRK